MTFSRAGYWGDTFTDRFGNGQADTPVTVKLAGTATLATLYTAADKLTTAANPFTTDELGNGSFYADPGEYDLVANGTTVKVLVPVDPTEATLGPRVGDSIVVYGYEGTQVLAPGVYNAITMLTYPDDWPEFSGNGPDPSFGWDGTTEEVVVNADGLYAAQALVTVHQSSLQPPPSTVFLRMKRNASGLNPLAWYSAVIPPMVDQSNAANGTVQVGTMFLPWRLSAGDRLKFEGYVPGAVSLTIRYAEVNLVRVG